MIYLELLWVFIQVGLLSIGGGYAALPIIQSLVVDGNGWLTFAEFSELITIAEMTPGPISLNAATFVGIQMAGIPGALVATLGMILPACIIVTLLAFLYTKFKSIKSIQGVLKQLRPAIVGLIAAAFLTLFINAIWGDKSNITLATTNWVSISVFILSLLALRIKKINPILILIVSGIVGMIVYFVT
ncbi:MAG: chromate transporter [Clostridia bacterium]|nr:chromate transporter [Clostridia bacterium]